MFRKLFKVSLLLFIGIAICMAAVGYYFYNQLQRELPNIEQLQNVEYQIPLTVYSRDGQLLAQFGEKKRIPIEIDDVPQQLINAFLAAEDDDFYSHPGVDYKGLLRAAYQLALTGKKRQGGSTITMQVTRNFLLSKEKTYKRKLKEIILALRIENKYSKNKILQLYLNKIYLGHRSYGVAAAASTYYGKDLNDLDLAQLAMIAGLPKAPSSYNPLTNPKKALQRRNYVLRRMLELGYIAQTDYEKAVAQAISAAHQSNNIQAPAPYIAEMVRKKIVEQFGDHAFTRGIKVFTTIDSKLQAAATQAVYFALHRYDHRHGYRSLPHKNQPEFAPSEFVTIADTVSAQVVEIKNNTAQARLKNGTLITLPFEKVKWARRFKTRNYLGPKLKSIKDILKVNDLIKVRKLKNNTWELTQIPEPQAAFVALDAKTGGILALSGGFDFFYNKYNRATQSQRQPGSGFKPIIYTTALEKGYTAATMINDAPVVVTDPSQESEWRPENYSKKFFGMTPLRTGLRKSRNLISIRILRDIGIQSVIKTALRFGFDRKQLPNSLSLALGSGYATPLQMASVYSVFANGGFRIKPYFIERIEDYKGNVLFEAAPALACTHCRKSQNNTYSNARIISPQINFLMNSLLRDVVQRGTATPAKVLNRKDLAGKTGTTNDQRDAWFNGFSAGIAATAWIGFDSSKTLGRYETGTKAALPLWIEFMKTALKDKPESILTPPPGIIKVHIDPKTGLLAQPGSKGGIWEYFRTQYAPTLYAPIEAEEDKQDVDVNEDGLF